jgi:GT2 family glycosyltransferase
MEKFKLSVVIPNYNGQPLLAANLPAVIKACRQWSTRGWEVIVVDDGSTDNSVAFLKKEFPKVKRVVHKKNQRFAAACNSGVKKAKGKLVVLLNNDVSPSLNFLKPLLRHFEDEKVFAVGCREKSRQGGQLVYSGRSLGRFRQGFLVHWRAKNQDQPDTLWATGGSMAVDREKWLEIGGMDTLFRPAYWEDIDLSWRAKQRGWQVIFEPRSIVTHDHDTSNVVAFGKSKMKKYAYKNQFLFVWKNGSLKEILAWLFWMPLHLLKAVFDGDWLFWLGFLLALKQLPELLFNYRK